MELSSSLVNLLIPCNYWYQKTFIIIHIPYVLYLFRLSDWLLVTPLKGCYIWTFFKSIFLYYLWCRYWCILFKCSILVFLNANCTLTLANLLFIAWFIADSLTVIRSKNFLSDADFSLTKAISSSWVSCSFLSWIQECKDFPEIEHTEILVVTHKLCHTTVIVPPHSTAVLFHDTVMQIYIFNLDKCLFSIKFGHTICKVMQIT